MKTEIKDHLISLLESGEYKKGDGELYNIETDCHCVLGVLTEMAIGEGAWVPNTKMGRWSNRKELDIDSAWELNEEIRTWAGSTEDELSELAEINDNSKSWDQVITYIKENL